MTLEFEDLPGIFIPCENLKALKELILELYNKGIITNETWDAVNVPDNFLEIMNDPSYFETGELCGFIYRKKGAKDLERLNEDLL